MAGLYPFLFTPVFKDYIWGGRALADFGRALPAGRVAESWEIAAHPDGVGRVANGPRAGTPLDDLSRALGTDLIGTRGAWADERGVFPLLVKLLDCREPLSVQVHPDDAFAQAHEGNELGKTEMWVVLRAEPDAAIIYGVTRGTTRERFRSALADGALEPCLHRLFVDAGDAICVPAGTVHAILGGLVIAEIQQNSNTTYRVYDWKRVGADGKPRALHVDRALDVIDFDRVEPAAATPTAAWQRPGLHAETLCRNDRFITERVTMAAGAVFEGLLDGSTLEIWGAIDGAAEVVGGGEIVPLPAVTFALLPAALGRVLIRAARGAVLLRTYLPEVDA